MDVRVIMEYTGVMNDSPNASAHFVSAMNRVYSNYNNGLRAINNVLDSGDKYAIKLVHLFLFGELSLPPSIFINHINNNSNIRECFVDYIVDDIYDFVWNDLSLMRKINRISEFEFIDFVENGELYSMSIDRLELNTDIGFIEDKIFEGTGDGCIDIHDILEKLFNLIMVYIFDKYDSTQYPNIITILYDQNTKLEIRDRFSTLISVDSLNDCSYNFDMLYTDIYSVIIQSFTTVCVEFFENELYNIDGCRLIQFMMEDMPWNTSINL